MHKNLLAALLGLNGLTLLVIGLLIALSTRSQLGDLELGATQVEQIAPTFYGLGLADASSSLFSFLAMVLVYRKQPSGRALALVVAANQLIVGVGLYVFTSVLAGLLFIAARGAVIGALAWTLPDEGASVPPAERAA